MRDLNLLQVMPKQRIESIGRRSNIDKRWSWGKKDIIGDDDDTPTTISLLFLLLLLFSADMVRGWRGGRRRRKASVFC